jgi:hypothetical protein
MRRPPRDLFLFKPNGLDCHASLTSFRVSIQPSVAALLFHDVVGLVGRAGGGCQGGSGMGGIQGWPVIALRRAARTSVPCLLAVEMYPRMA